MKIVQKSSFYKCEKKPLKKTRKHSGELTNHMADETMETELNAANFPLLKKIHQEKTKPAVVDKL